jgi:putative DNA primase/helicase
MNAPMKNALTVAAVRGVEEVNANVLCADVNTEENVVEPNWLQPRFDSIPDALKQQPWAVWIAEPRPGKPGKFNKAPRSPSSGRKIGADKPHLFGNFDAVQATYDRGGYTGVGVLLTGKGIVGVDIDDIRNTIARWEVKQWLSEAIDDGAYCEKSPSGTGLRLFMKGKLPGKGRKYGACEIYDDVRFLTVTGHVITTLEDIWVPS